MIKNCRFENGQAIVTYEFSVEEVGLLSYLKESKYIEFRARSTHGIDYGVAEDLIKYGFADVDDDAKHLTLVLTELGQCVVDSME